jgi:hypothetical protein
MLGFSRLQRSRLRSSRKPTPQLHGRAQAASRTSEYDKPPFGTHEQIPHEPREEAIKKFPTLEKTNDIKGQGQERGKGRQKSVVAVSEWENSTIQNDASIT